ncbi:MAG: hypothetical protein ACLFTT_09575 [Candidatus Hydrogenedentota bacterium]
MMSLTEVTCPHCGTKGQVIMPPAGAIIVGPCPQCEDMVVLFCERVLPLDSKIILQKSSEEKRQHLLDVLTGFLQERLQQLFDGATPPGHIQGVHDEPIPHKQTPAEKKAIQEEVPETAEETAEEWHISMEEIEKFTQMDLPLLDNKDYFHAIFG